MNRLFCGPLLLLTLATSGCGPSAAHQATLAGNKLLQQQVQFLQEDLTRVTNEAKGAARTIESARTEASRREQETKAEREALKKQLEQVLKEFEAYKTNYRLTSHKRATGQRLPQLDCGAHRIFADVEILSLTPGEMRFRHASGLGKVPLGQLSADLRERFGYDPEKAAAWLATEREKQRDEETAALIAETKTANAALSRAKSERPPANAAIRRRYQENLNALYVSANELQADRNCCPVHKRYQLADLSVQASELKRKIAALP